MENNTKVLIMSDAHGEKELAESILKKETFDYFIYAGDWENNEDTLILENYKAISVCGNWDSIKIFENHKIINLEGVSFFITHGHLFYDSSEYVSKKKIISFMQNKNIEADIILHGHTHITRDVVYEGKRFICPGSISQPRSSSDRNGTYKIITIKNNKISNVETMYI